MANERESKRLKMEASKRVLDAAARIRRNRQAVEALYMDNYHDDPHGDLVVNKKAPKFEDTPVGKKKKKKKSTGNADYYKIRYRKSVEQMLEYEESVRPKQIHYPDAAAPAPSHPPRAGLHPSNNAELATSHSFRGRRSLVPQSSQSEIDCDSGIGSMPDSSKDATPEKKRGCSPCTPQFDEDEEDETLAERLWGLTEMFPESLRDATFSVYCGSKAGVKGLYSLTRTTMWIIFSSSAILLAPVLFEVERAQVEEAQRVQHKQVLLGPNTAGGMPYR